MVGWLDVDDQFEVRVLLALQRGIEGPVGHILRHRTGLDLYDTCAAPTLI